MNSISLTIRKHPFLFVLSIALFAIFLFFPFILLLLVPISWYYNRKYPERPQATYKSTYKDKGEGTLTSNPFMSATEKSEYLQSPKWKELKQAKLDQVGHKCEFCGAISHLHLHHITYDKLGDEDLSDLAILCDKHHKQIHDKLGKDRLTTYPLSALED